jgi:hypothetical protein
MPRWLILIVSLASLTLLGVGSQFAVPQIPFSTDQQAVTQVRGMEAGNANDDNPFTFMFAKDNSAVWLKKLDGTKIQIEDVEGLYNTEDGMRIFSDGTEVTFKHNLIPQGMDLFNNSGWPNIKVPAGILPIDPNTGRFVLQLPQFDKLEPMGNLVVGTKGTDISVNGQYAYVTDESGGLKIVNISDPMKPLSGAYYRFNYNLRATSVQVVGRYAYLTVIGPTFSALQILDIAPRIPQGVRYILLSGSPVMEEIVGDYAYMANSDEGVKILSIKDIKTQDPQIIGSYAGKAMYMYVVGDYVYVADKAAGLQILKIDTSNAGQPTLSKVGSSSTNGEARRVEVVGKYAYVGTSTGLEIFDISDPSQAPKSVGYLETGPDMVNEIQVIGTYAFLTDSNAGIRVIDISDPTHPLFVGEPINTGGSAFAIQAVNDYLYVVNNDSSGLKIFHAIFNFNPVTGSVQVDYNY